MLNTTVKNHGVERSYIQCELFFKQQKSLESALAAWFKQACENNTSIDGTHLKKNISHITICPGIANFSTFNGWIDRFKRRYSIIYRTLSGESRVLIQKLYTGNVVIM
jgi:hypothetical protein